MGGVRPRTDVDILGVGPHRCSESEELCCSAAHEKSRGALRQTHAVAPWLAGRRPARGESADWPSCAAMEPSHFFPAAPRRFAATRQTRIRQPAHFVLFLGCGYLDCGYS